MHRNIVGQKRDKIKTAHLPMWTLMHKIKEWTIKSFLELYKARLLIRMLLSNSIHHSTWHLHRVYSRVSDDRIFAIQKKNSLRNYFMYLWRMRCRSDMKCVTKYEWTVTTSFWFWLRDCFDMRTKHGQNMDQGSMDPHLGPVPWIVFVK